MAVTGKNKVVFCEGKLVSLDFKVIDRIAGELQDKKITIVPAGGKFAFHAFAHGYFFPNEVEGQRYIVFRDRDFDIEPNKNVKLIELRKGWFLTWRACIENYLLDSSLIDDYWRYNHGKKQSNENLKWGHGDSPGIQAIDEWIEESARTIQEYQAVRWALADLLEISSACVRLKSTWTSGSGNLPESMELEYCKTKARELINNFRQAADSATCENFENSLSKYQNQFKDDEFWEKKQYLCWFHGKDIQKAMQKQKNQFISLKLFFEWAVNRFDIKQYPDLLELQEKIKQL